MRLFTELFIRLDQTNSTNAKIAAMVDYFNVAPYEDAALAVWFLTGRRLKGLIKRAELREWALHATGLPEWLLEETYQSVGDSAETIALLLPDSAQHDASLVPLHQWVDRIKNLSSMTPKAKQQSVCAWWSALTSDERFVLNKMMTGAFRVGVSQRLVVRALAQVFQLEPSVIAHRMMGDWSPDSQFFTALGNPDTTTVSKSTPYPFFLAAPLLDPPESLGDIREWQVEWKWDGIRAQLIRRSKETFLWSRGEELMNGRFPEIERAAELLPDGCVLDGEIIPWLNGKALPFAQLQRRIGKRNPGKKLLAEVPVTFLAYDAIELEGIDQRQKTQRYRRQSLEKLIRNQQSPDISPMVKVNDWAALAALRGKSRSRGVEGLMLKHLDSPYLDGRKRGHWWKWKVDPLTIDAVLIYAQPGSGRRSNLLTDYTFAVWREDELVPVCKAYSGLDNAEITRLDRWIRQNTKERFGPVRSVQPYHVFEIAFEGIQKSGRHKSGVALRFPRIARWRDDKSVEQADSLGVVQDLLTLYQQASG